MKIGAENRTKVIVLAVLGVVAVISVVYMVTAVGSRPLQEAAPPVSSGNPAGRPLRRVANRESAMAPSLDPELRLKLLESSESTKYEGTGHNIFALEPIPEPVAPALLKKPEPPPGPPPPPPPPPINLKFFGFASHPGQPKRVFLAMGDDVFTGGEGDIVDRRYKIVRIHSTSVEIEDVLTNNRQTILLTQPQP